jgi:hypothetical protein
MVQWGWTTAGNAVECTNRHTHLIFARSRLVPGQAILRLWWLEAIAMQSNQLLIQNLETHQRISTPYMVLSLVYGLSLSIFHSPPPSPLPFSVR